MSFRGGALAISTLGGLVLAVHAASCAPSSPSSPSTFTDGGKDGSGSSSTSPCDPLVPPATHLGTVLGVGQDTQALVYAADQWPDASFPGRVFVSDGGALQRQHVAGTGQVGGPPSASYAFTFAPAFAPASDLRSLLILTSGGVATTMELGPPTVRDPRSAADAGETPLTVLDAGVIQGLPVENLPYIVLHVADISDGHVLVVVEPMDISDPTGMRLFFGTEPAMVEYRIASMEADDSGEYFSFVMGGMLYNVFFDDPFLAPDANPGPQPGSFYANDAGPSFGNVPGALQVNERTPTPTSLAGFSFECLQ